MTPADSIPASPVFSTRWFNRHRKTWLTFMREYVDQPTRYLEIGVFEGRSACWMLTNILAHPGSTYTGIDPWMPSRKHPDSLAVEARARGNLSPFANKVEIIKGKSQDILQDERWQLGQFNIAYIDGAHGAGDVIADSILVWPLVEPGGLVIWDDYKTRRRSNSVAGAVESFLNGTGVGYTVLWKGSQLGVKKA